MPQGLKVVLELRSVSKMHKDQRNAERTRMVSH